MSQIYKTGSGGGGGGGIQIIDTDSASVTGTTVKLLASTGNQKAGSSVSFVASDTDQINLITTDANLNTLIGEFAGNASVNTPGGSNTGLGYTALFTLTEGIGNVGIGYSALSQITDGGSNVGVGSGALSNVGGASFNVAVGTDALANVGPSIGGHDNVGIGTESLTSLDTGNENTAVGSESLSGLSNASSNCIGIGFSSGINYNSGTENSNIVIGNAGVTSESNVTRIGTQGTGAGQQNKCYVAGITGATVTGTAVLCATDGQLGTVVSSKRYKYDIYEIDEDLSVLNLNPVHFRYISDDERKSHYGLIAEEVHEEFPYLCFYNKEGEPESVKYHELPVFLLKEIQRLNERINKLEKKTKVEKNSKKWF